MDIFYQIVKNNQLLYITIVEMVMYTILPSLILYHLIIYLGRRNFKESKYYLYFSFFVLGLLLYIFSDSFTYWIVFPKFFKHTFTLFFTAISFLIMFKSIILLLNSSLDLHSNKKRLVDKLFNYYAVFSLIWIIPGFIKVPDAFNYFWAINFLFIIFLSFIYLGYLIKNSNKIDTSIKTIAWVVLCYLIYTEFYRAIFMFFPKTPTTPFWIMNDTLKIIVSVVFAIALAIKTNKDYYDLQELKEHLEQKVLEKTQELREANTRIAENNEQRTNYFVNLAHETKTPLTLISNYLDRHIKNSGPTKELNIIKENFDKLKNEMIRLLDVEKYEKGLMIYDHNSIQNFSELITRLEPLYQEHAHLHQIKLVTEIDNNVFIKSDPIALEGVVNNIFENAIKYSGEGSTIKIILKNSGKEANLCISDTGSGIEDEKLKYIFQPYYQVSRTKLNKEGLGMGLFIVKNIVDSLNGKISVHSKVNMGTEITITMPREISVATDIIKPNQIVEPSLKKKENKQAELSFSPEQKNILIVEDNIDMRNYLAIELNNDFNVFCADNGLDALAKLKSIPAIDIILSDVMMDYMDGNSFYDAMSKSERFSTIPFIMLTAKSDNNEKIEMLSKGVTDYIFKPFSIDELKAKIESVLINTKNQRTAVLKETLNIVHNRIISENGNGKDKWGKFELLKKEHNLTDRQIEIIELVENGLEYKQIADKLNISVKTTHRHIQNIFEKFGVHSKVELIKVLFG